jgi:nucleotide-binding universal stress UspA family protein
MISIRRILWPTDFSDLSKRALPVANELASRFSARVDVLHVLIPPPAMVSLTGQGAVAATEYLQALDDNAKARLEEIVAEDVAQGVEAESALRRGAAAHEIVRFAEENDDDLIVIATQGETGFSRLVFGSVAEKVVRLAPCPVLSVPAGKDEGTSE